MSRYQTLMKDNKVKCWLLKGILRLNNLSCFKEVHICLCFITCVMLRI